MIKFRILETPSGGLRRASEALRFIAHKNFYTEVFKMEMLREMALRIVKRRYPHKGTPIATVEGEDEDAEVVRRPSKNLKEGFVAYPFGNSKEQAGFTVMHRDSGKGKVNVILAVKEKGHKAFTLAPTNRLSLRWGTVRGPRRIRFAKRVEMKKVRGSHFLERSGEEMMTNMQTMYRNEAPRNMKRLLRSYGVPVV